ncbi:Ger(x)C family spore germination protein [Paenibacillus sp. PK3_47]|nr:Ger(x)C family spore germination protein [Paenibacillus sp. PK3_47]
MRFPGLVLFLLSMSLVLTSCYNSRELNELSIVSGIGLDRVPDSDDYKVTFQVVNPSATSTSTGAGSGLPAITVISATDATIFGALRKASKRATRQLFFAHTQLLVVGEPLVRHGVYGLFDIFERSHELRLNTEVVIARDTEAASILKVLTPVESLPSQGIVKKTQNTARVWGENRSTKVFDLIKAITGEGDLTINGIRIIGEPAEGMKKSGLEQSELKAATVMSGLGVLKEGKLIDWLEGPEARGTQWVLNRIKETNINISSPDKKNDVAVNIFFSKTKSRVEIRDGNPVFHVHIREEGIIYETGGFVDLSRKAELQKLEDELEEQTKAEIKLAVQNAQKLKADIFNFGNELKRTHPEYWRKAEGKWDELFARGELVLHVEAYIRSTGMRLKPYIPAKE